MPISENDIVVGGVYKTPNNQERVVLAVEDGKIKYASRGGNVKNPFDHMEKSEPARFANSCSEKIEDLPSDEFDGLLELFRSRRLINN
ncbi:hypothetical protein PEC730217_41090 [Pectobacterium carotovorum subsp. carotovorum]|nr:hypothetical protein PEC730217_41090 [Pectobacterium carotovorum subsp. carotovorum]